MDASGRSRPAGASRWLTSGASRSSRAAGTITAVQKAMAAGKLQGNESFAVKCTLEIPSLGVRVPFDGEIKLK